MPAIGSGSTNQKVPKGMDRFITIALIVLVIISILGCCGVFNKCG